MLPVDQLGPMATTSPDYWHRAEMSDKMKNGIGNRIIFEQKVAG
jgi:hypothetical protein